MTLECMRRYDVMNLHNIRAISNKANPVPDTGIMFYSLHLYQYIKQVKLLKTIFIPS